MPSTVDVTRPTDLRGHENKPEGSFLQRLEAESWRALLQAGLRARTFERDEHLPMGPGDRNVYIIWDGLVRQDRFPLGEGDNVPAVIRFRGSGQLVGEGKLIDPGSAVITKCLTRTLAIPCRARYFNVLLRKRAEIQLALGQFALARARAEFGRAIADGT